MHICYYLRIYVGTLSILGCSNIFYHFKFYKVRKLNFRKCVAKNQDNFIYIRLLSERNAIIIINFPNSMEKSCSWTWSISNKLIYIPERNFIERIYIVENLSGFPQVITRLQKLRHINIGIHTIFLINCFPNFPD